MKTPETDDEQADKQVQNEPMHMEDQREVDVTSRPAPASSPQQDVDDLDDCDGQ